MEAHPEQETVDEKRRFERAELNMEVVVTIDNSETYCTIRNLSDGGAFLRIDEKKGNHISEEHLNREAVFTMAPEGKITAMRYKGKICRYFEESGCKYIAVAFYNYFG